MAQTPQFPGEDEGRLLHAALSGSDPIASSSFAEAFYAPFCAYLAIMYRHVSEDVRVSVASDLILKLIQQPQIYDPQKLPVCGFLRMAAWRKLATATERETRRRRREISLDLVADPGAAGNKSMETDEPAFSDPRLRAEIAAFNEAEKLVLELILSGERGTEVFARALGLEPKQHETALVVKRLKDTIKVRLRRAVGGR